MVGGSGVILSEAKEPELENLTKIRGLAPLRRSG